MTHDEMRLWLIDYLVNENDGYNGIHIPEDCNGQWMLLRSLMNVRPALPIGEEFLSVQDEFLSEEIARKGITDIASLSEYEGGGYISGKVISRR